MKIDILRISTLAACALTLGLASPAKAADETSRTVEQLVTITARVVKTDLAAEFTREDPLGNPPPSPLATPDFIGIRAYLGYEFKLSENSKLTEDLNLIENLDTILTAALVVNF